MQGAGYRGYVAVAILRDATWLDQTREIAASADVLAKSQSKHDETV